MSGVNTTSNKFNYDSNLFTPQHGVNYFNDNWYLVRRYDNNIIGNIIDIYSTSMFHIYGSISKNIATNILSYCKITTYRGIIYVPLSPYKSIDQFDYILFADALFYKIFMISSIEYYDKSEKAIDKPDDVYFELYIDMYSM